LTVANGVAAWVVAGDAVKDIAAGADSDIVLIIRGRSLLKIWLLPMKRTFKGGSAEALGTSLSLV